ncbi:MAG: nitrogen fixation protein NifX [Gammaproteobacteria bacterium]|nr:nitrogen fixation protein NifX [Gammaproteobacteria bacterium]
MAAALKVAFASSDMIHVDQHFGAAKSFVIYAVDKNRSCVLEAIEFTELKMDGNEDKLAGKVEALGGCIAVYSQAVGASAIGLLKAHGIQPVKVTSGSPIRALLDALQEELTQGPASWLARAIAATLPADPSRFDVMEDEGWQE